MHSLDFFRRLGLYCEPDFLDGPALAGLFGQIRTALPVPARVFGELPGAVVDMAVRHTWEMPLNESALDLAERLGALRADLAQHFHVPLVAHEGPTLLMYPPGGFYEPHDDGAREVERTGIASRRRVSVVIFVNRMRADPGPGDYAGGALTFYGLVDDPAWRQFGFALDPQPGLLVAFPSHLVHEVTPVTAGDRYTIVDWFTQ